MDDCLIRISEVEERMTDKLVKSHQGISESVSGFGKDLKTLAGRLAEHTEHEEHYQRKVETHMDEENENYGKMTREFTDKLDKYVVADMKWKEEYIIADTKFKEDVIAYMTEMLPVKEGLHWVQTLNKFAKWAGLPAIGAMAAYWLVK